MLLFALCLGNLNETNLNSKSLMQLPDPLYEIARHIYHVKTRRGTNLYGNGSGKLLTVKLLKLAMNLYLPREEYWFVLASTTTHSKYDWCGYPVGRGTTKVDQLHGKLIDDKYM